MPYTGIHWSDYGAYLAADSTLRYLRIKSAAGAGIPVMHIDKVELSARARDDDADLNKTMNLIWEPSHPSLAYPVLSYAPVKGSKKPRALFIGDSFFWPWYFQGIIQNEFDSAEFWYYDKTIFPAVIYKSVCKHRMLI